MHDRVKVAVTEDVPIIDRGRDRKRAVLILRAPGTVVLGASIAYGFYERAEYYSTTPRTPSATRSRRGCGIH